MNELGAVDDRSVGFDFNTIPDATPIKEEKKKKKKGKGKKKKKEGKEHEKEGDKNFIIRNGSKKEGKKGKKEASIKDEDKLYSFSLGDLDNAQTILPSRRGSFVTGVAEKKDNTSGSAILRSAKESDEESIESNDDANNPASPLGKRQFFGRKLSFFNNNKQQNGAQSPRLSQEIAGAASSKLRLTIPAAKEESR